MRKIKVKGQVFDENCWFQEPSEHFPKCQENIESTRVNHFKSLLITTSPGANVQISKSLSVAIDGLASLACKRWLSDEIITAISNLINSSFPDVYVRNLFP